VDGEVDEGGVEQVGTSTGTKTMAPLLALFSANVISLEYAFLLFLFTDLVNRLAGIADGK
jgi:hypothetical protein